MAIYWCGFRWNGVSALVKDSRMTNVAIHLFWHLEFVNILVACRTVYRSIKARGRECEKNDEKFSSSGSAIYEECSRPFWGWRDGGVEAKPPVVDTEIAQWPAGRTRIPPDSQKWKSFGRVWWLLRGKKKKRIRSQNVCNRNAATQWKAVQ